MDRGLARVVCEVHSFAVVSFGFVGFLFCFGVLVLLVFGFVWFVLVCGV